jgi:hypothetical protein
MTEADSTADPGALTAVANYIDALNRRDLDGIRAAFHFPHAQLRAGSLIHYATPAELSYAGFYKRMAAEQWTRSTWDGHKVALAGPDKVHLDVWFTRWRADGTAIGTHHSLYIVTRIAGRWGIQVNSSYG